MKLQIRFNFSFHAYLVSISLLWNISWIVKCKCVRY